MYEVIYHKNPTRNFKTDNPNDILKEFNRFCDPTKTHAELKAMLESGATLNFQGIATAKKID